MTLSIEKQKHIEDLLRSCAFSSMSATARAAGVSYGTLQVIAKRLGLWQPNQGGKGVASKDDERFHSQISLEDILAGLHPNYASSKLKKRLVRAQILPDVCVECGLGRSWQGCELSLQLDHENGDSNDHRLKNLRILCPNCHSQTETYAGRGKRAKGARPSAFRDAKDAIVESLLAGASIRQCLLQAGLPDAKCHYESVQLLVREYPTLTECPGLQAYKPNRTAKAKRSPAEYREQQHQLWLVAQAEKLELLQAASFEFQRYGWVTKVARLLDMNQQKVVPWIRKVDPEFLNKCKLRSTRA